MISKKDFIKIYRLLKFKYQEVDFNDKGFLFFTLITIFFIGAFIPIRWVQGEMNLVATNIFVVLTAMSVHVLLVSGHNVLARKIFVSFMFLMLVYMINKHGASQLNWVYPGGAMLFFSLKPKTALKVSSVLIVIIGWLVWEELSWSRWLQDIVSLIGSSCIVFTFCIRVDQHIKYLNSQSMIDEMSGLNNRRSFDHDISRLKMHEDKSYYLFILDVDHFKRINDSYGHDIGDAVIKHLSKELQENLRDDEISYRIGGEEFAVIIGAANDNRARECAERLRQLIEESSFTTHKGEEIVYTVSVGVSIYINDAVKWFRQADRALYRAKDKGRNNVQFNTDC